MVLPLVGEKTGDRPALGGELALVVCNARDRRGWVCNQFQAVRIGGGREAFAIGSGPVEPHRFADTWGTSCLRAFDRSTRDTLARSARRCSRRRRRTVTDITATIARSNANNIRVIP
jgi:hypothetical protein